MITVHHLNNSRSQRILWLLEELSVPYEIAHYQRDAMTSRAPDSLKAVHPLGKSPVITDDGRTIAESGAIVDYIVRHYGDGRLSPAAGTPAYDDYVEWLHYAEGSAMMPLLMDLFFGFLGTPTPLQPIIEAEIAMHLAYINHRLGDRPFFVGDDLTGADVQMAFVLEFARARGHLVQFPKLAAYVDRMQARPAYRSALERGGPYELAAFRGARQA